MNNKPTVCIFGKLPPPYMGPAIATQILLQSRLKNNFNLELRSCMKNLKRIGR